LTGEQFGAPLAVTTSGKPDERTIAVARQSALAWGVPFIERRRKAPLRPILDIADSLLVFERNQVALCDRGGTLRFSPGMARLRIKRLQALAREDRLVELGEFRPGEFVLDCTLGLAADALVAAWAVGSAGRVVGLEKSLALFALVSTGLAAFECPHSCRIDVRHEDASAFLARQPAKSFDVVLFDPMFDHPGRCSPAFEMLRRYAEHTPLDLRDAMSLLVRSLQSSELHSSTTKKDWQGSADLDRPDAVLEAQQRTAQQSDRAAPIAQR